jgi:hypothetical protein
MCVYIYKLKLYIYIYIYKFADLPKRTPGFHDRHWTDREDHVLKAAVRWLEYGCARNFSQRKCFRLWLHWSHLSTKCQKSRHSFGRLCMHHSKHETSLVIIRTITYSYSQRFHSDSWFWAMVPCAVANISEEHPSSSSSGREETSPSSGTPTIQFTFPNRHHPAPGL